MSDGRSVRLFLVDGTSGGLLTAEIMNWTGTVVAAPRSLLAELLKREETTGTGVYILIGDDPEQLGGTIVYVGEGDDVQRRLKMHARQPEAGGKDFWNRALVLSSKDANLTKSHVRYVESRLISLAKAAGRAKLDNATAPPLPRLPEADVSDMEYFISQSLIVLPVLGLNMFRSSSLTSRVGSADATSNQNALSGTGVSPLFELRLGRFDITATAQEVDGDFTVMTGSGARPEWVSSSHGYKVLHEQLLADGSIAVDETGAAHFTRDVPFASPSAAGAVVSGRSCNGRVQWQIVGTGETYGHWQNRGVEDVPMEQIDD